MNGIYDRINEKLTTNDKMVFPVIANILAGEGTYSEQEFAEIVEKKLNEGNSFFNIVHEIERQIHEEKGVIKRWDI